MTHVPTEPISLSLRPEGPARVLLPLILALSLGLNLWGNEWGAPSPWHPDEVIGRAVRMVVQRTLHPSQFAYGSLHTNLLALGAVAPVGAYAVLVDREPDEAHAAEVWKERQLARVYLLARSISALLATAQVFLTYLIGTIVFGGAVGVLAALFLAVAPYFVVIAHFATVDTAASFWYWLSVLFAVLVWRRGGRTWYWLGALTAGLATGIKVDRLLAVLPLLAAHGLRREGLQFRRLLGFGLLVPAGYILANPWLLISPFEFLDGTTRDLFFNMVREPPAGETAVASMLAAMADGFGLPLFLIAVVGMAYAVRNIVKGRDRAALGLLLVTVLPYFLLFGLRLAGVWYVPFFFPALALFAAYGSVVLVRALSPQRYAVGLVVALVAASAGYSLLRAVAFDLSFVKDSRHLTAEWIDRNVPDGTTIGVGPRGPGPFLSDEKYRLLERPMDPRYLEFTVQWQENLERHALYNEIRQRILDLERYVGAEFGTPVRDEPYRAWFDGVRESLQTVVADPEQWHEEPPDYVVLVDYLEQERVAALQEPGSGYRPVARIRYENPFGFDLEFPFVNPEVFVFRRTGSAM